MFCFFVYSFWTFYQINQYGTSTNEQSNLGQYLSGTAGFLISVASILALAIAFISQKQQISLQQKELEDNQVLNNTVRFENNFFQLLTIHINIFNSLEKPNEKSMVVGARETVYFKGAKHFENLYDDFKNNYLKKAQDSITTTLDIKHAREIINEQYLRFNHNNSAQLQHCMRSLFQILKYVYSKKSLLNLDTKFYANIVKAHISTYELLLIFYNGISDLSLYNSEKLNFKKLIEEFNLFEHLDKVDFDYYPTLLNLYNKDAYNDGYERNKIIYS